MENESSENTYEDARKQRLIENKKRFEDLGLVKLSRSLSDLSKSEKSQHRSVRSKRVDSYSIEPRRSSRARNSIASYRDDVDVGLPALRKRSKFNSSWASYLARPIEEVKSATFEERTQAYKSAEKLQSNLRAGNPSFIKSMVRSHVYSCFWLGLPTRFCVSHLPKTKTTVDMVLEDEEGSEYEAIFITKRTGLSGGWRAFALDHKLDDGDALVFELIEPTRFKVYIVRAFNSQDQKINVPTSEIGSDAEEKHEKEIKNGEKIDSDELESITKSKKEKSSATRRSLRNK